MKMFLSFATLLVMMLVVYGHDTCEPGHCSDNGVCAIVVFYGDLGTTMNQGPTCNCEESYIGRHCERRQDAGISLEPSDYVIRVPRGSNVTVTCHYSDDIRGKVMSFIPPSYKPFYYGQQSGHVSVEATFGQSTAKMHVHNIQQEDFGMYRCMVGTRMKAFWLQADDVHGNPTIEITKAHGDVVSKGNPTWLVCKVTDIGAARNPSLKWYDASGQRVTSLDVTAREVLQYNIGEKYLILRLSDPEPGLYRCVAEDAETGLVSSTSAQLDVTDEPLIHIAREQTLTPDDSLIKCYSTDPLNKNVRLYREGTLLSDGTKYQKHFQGVRILRLGSEDAGVYTCRSEDPRVGKVVTVEINARVEMAHPLSSPGPAIEI